MGIHANLANDQLHEPKGLKAAVAADAGKVLTPSAVDNVSELRKLLFTEIDLDTTGGTDEGKALFASSTDDVGEIRFITGEDIASGEINADSVGFEDDADNTKTMHFDLSGITASTDRVLVIQDVAGTVALAGKPRTQSVASSATVPTNADDYDVSAVQDLAENTVVAAPTGTPVDGQRLTYRIREDGTGGYTIGWDAVFHGPNAGAPTAATTTADNTNIWEFMYNATDSIWEEVSATVGIS